MQKEIDEDGDDDLSTAMKRVRRRVSSVNNEAEHNKEHENVQVKQSDLEHVPKEEVHRRCKTAFFWGKDIGRRLAGAELFSIVKEEMLQLQAATRDAVLREVAEDARCRLYAQPYVPSYYF